MGVCLNSKNNHSITFSWIFKRWILRSYAASLLALRSGGIYWKKLKLWRSLTVTAGSTSTSSICEQYFRYKENPDQVYWAVNMPVNTCALNVAAYAPLFYKAPAAHASKRRHERLPLILPVFPMAMSSPLKSHQKDTQKEQRYLKPKLQGIRVNSKREF